MTIETTEAKIGRSMKKCDRRIAVIAYLLACGAVASGFASVVAAGELAA